MSVLAEEIAAGGAISHFRILKRIGEGGMGVVYQALDTRLDRLVALKFLLPRLSRNARATQRFIREARSASVLDHPNICTVYEIDKTDRGQLFIAMAYCEGETLEERIGRERVSAEEALDITIQILDGLSAAHAQGVLHRDIKPANLILTQGGLVKIVDFGLAKLAGESRVTDSGARLGTVAYMSPEEVRGRNSSPRSDLWSVGVLLYEMLTGRPPFAGNAGATMYAIEHQDPPPLNSVLADVPAELNRILARSLTKRPEARYGSAEEFLADLLRLPESVRPRRRRAVYRRPPLRFVLRRWMEQRRVWRWALATAAVAVAALLLWMQFADQPKPFLLLTNPKLITSVDGVESWPSWSPDGKHLAYETNHRHERDIWVVNLETGETVQRTLDYAGYDGQPSWSPDGNWITFVSNRDDGTILLVPALGGVERRLVQYDELLRSPEWSPNGSDLAYIKQSPEGGMLETTNLSTQEIRQFPLQGPGPYFGNLSPSPSGRFCAYASGLPGAEHVGIWLLDLTTGECSPVTSGQDWDWHPRWRTDDRAVYFLSKRAGTGDLWVQRLNARGRPAGAPEQLTTGVGIHRMAFSPDGSQLAYAKGTGLRPPMNLWRIPLTGDRVATWEDTEQLTFDLARAMRLDLSPDGRMIAFSSNRSGSWRIWEIPAAGGTPRQITKSEGHDWWPVWSPDGTQLVFESDRAGSCDIWVRDQAHGGLRRLTDWPDREFSPCWSPDGTKIAFASDRGGEHQIWVIPAAGGQARQITRGGPPEKYHPCWSPDGETILFTAPIEYVWCLMRVPVSGGEAEEYARNAFVVTFASDGSSIYFAGRGPRLNQIWRKSLDTGEERLMADLSGKETCLSMCNACDETHIYFSWNEPIQADLWVMDVREP